MRLNVYGFLQFFRDFSNCFFSSLFVKNMPKHATRVKGVPGAFVREIRPINCNQPRLDRGPRCAEPGPGIADQAPGLLPGVPGIADQGSRQAPGIAEPGPGPGIADQGSRNPAQAPGIVQACQGSRTRPRPRDRLPGLAVRGTFPGVLGPPRAARIGGG